MRWTLFINRQSIWAIFTLALALASIGCLTMEFLLRLSNSVELENGEGEASSIKVGRLELNPLNYLYVGNIILVEGFNGVSILQCWNYRVGTGSS